MAFAGALIAGALILKSDEIMTLVEADNKQRARISEQQDHERVRQFIAWHDHENKVYAEAEAEAKADAKAEIKARLSALARAEAARKATPEFKADAIAEAKSEAASDARTVARARAIAIDDAKVAARPKAASPPNNNSTNGEPALAQCDNPNTPATTVNASAAKTPPVAVEHGISGVVNVVIQLDTNSRIVGTPTVQSSPSELLNGAAIEAAERSTFRTEVKNCKPVAETVIFAVEFNSN
jgi:outer membrane biosynthesis protein TonB